jgi:Mor family transcriptional regulator
MTSLHDDLYTLELEFPMDFADRLAETHEDGINAATVSALKFWVLLGEETRDLIIENANIHGITRAEFVRRAIHTHMNPPTPYLSNLHDDMPLKERREKRNAEIVYRALRGAPRAELAKQYQLSLIRIHQIVAMGKRSIAAQQVTQNWTE